MRERERGCWGGAAKKSLGSCARPPRSWSLFSWGPDLCVGRPGVDKDSCMGSQPEAASPDWGLSNGGPGLQSTLSPVGSWAGGGALSAAECGAVGTCTTLPVASNNAARFPSSSSGPKSGMNLAGLRPRYSRAAFPRKAVRRLIPSPVSCPRGHLPPLAPDRSLLRPLSHLLPVSFLLS